MKEYTDRITVYLSKSYINVAVFSCMMLIPTIITMFANSYNWSIILASIFLPLGIYLIWLSVAARLGFIIMASSILLLIDLLTLGARSVDIHPILVVVIAALPIALGALTTRIKQDQNTRISLAIIGLSTILLALSLIYITKALRPNFDATTHLFPLNILY